MMKALLHRRASAFALTLFLSLALLNPVSGLAAQDEPQPPPTAPPDRAPSYQPSQPAGALRVPGEPPAVGDLIVEDPLTFPGAIPGSVSCTSGRNTGDFVGEGYIVKVTGKCIDSSKNAALSMPPIPDLVVPDGEISLEAKAVSGQDRAIIFLAFRGRSDPGGGYEFQLSPSRGTALLLKGQENVPVIPLAERRDLAGRVSRDDWNQVAIRLDGQNIWILLNGQPILSAADSAYDRGWIGFGVARMGNVDDNVESAVVFRNLRISRLADGA
jgi:hypothetical protein